MNNNINSNPKRIAMYVIYDPDGKLDGYRKYYLEELRKVTDTIVAIVSGTITYESRLELEKLVDDILVRENKGLLAGSWLDGIKHIGWDKLYTYDELLMLNDSFFGPFYPLKDMFDAMEESDADFYGSMENFEDKHFRHVNGRGFKHGHFRGSICYFYVIRKRLLHSNEFKKYWSNNPVIKGDWDTYFFAEIDFYDYVKDCGFKIGSYQSQKLKGYFTDNLTQNMELLIKDEKIPFARIRPFANDVKGVIVNYARDPRKTLEYIRDNTQYNTDYIWDYLLRTKNLTNLFKQLQLEYIVSKDYYERNTISNINLGVIINICQKDSIDKILNYCKEFPQNTVFFITTTRKDVCDVVCDIFEKEKLKYKCLFNEDIKLPIYTVLRECLLDVSKCKYICYIHDKKNSCHYYSIFGEEISRRCYENLVGNKYIINNIINLLEENKRLGLLAPGAIYHGDYFFNDIMTWNNTYEKIKEMADKIGLKVAISPNIAPVAPYGDMFWFRPEALKNIIKYEFNNDDVCTDNKNEKMIVYTIEKLYAFIAQDAGYYYAEVVNSDEARIDINNFRFMLNDIKSILVDNGHYPYNYDVMIETLKLYKGQPLSFTLLLKHKCKELLPSPVWNIARNIYHIFK